MVNLNFTLLSLSYVNLMLFIRIYSKQHLLEVVESLPATKPPIQI